MATPSSSATSPSPPMAFLQPVSATSSVPSASQADTIEREKRKKAVQKFLARAELSNVTHTLRTRLSYASYKATHNVTNIPFRELEAQTQALSPAMSSSRSNAAKRKAPGTAHYYNPPTQPGHILGATSSPLRRGSTGPSASTLSQNPRSHFTSMNEHNAASSSMSPSGTDAPPNLNAPTLFSSILAPPPANQARTILNAYDPPVPAPIRPEPSPRVRSPKAVRSVAEGTRGQAKSRHTDRNKSDKRRDKAKEKRPASHKSKRSRKNGVQEDGDVDMEAAATLTSLLLHHRPSMASTSSPRSSVDSSDAASSYSQFPQAPSRSFPPGSSTSVAPNASQSSVSTDVSYRNRTPPAGTATPAQHSTPRPAPTDNEAADLMLFLATSPSPARPTNKDAKDMAAFRALGTSAGVMRAKGRVLFPTHSQSSLSGEPGPSSETDDPGRHTPRPAGTAPLMRGGESSFASSISSIGTEMVSSSQGPQTVQATSSQVATRSTSPAQAQVQLLPPASLPTVSAATPSGPQSSRLITGSSTALEASGSNGTDVDMHTNNVTSTGVVGTIEQPQPIPNPTRANPSLRADLGRKLFEEEQLRAGITLGLSGQGIGQQRRADDRRLDAGIDLVQT
ncbi:hypothetical protein K435DRAFT_688074 [Dendrothele bispora CBS 962.96]|uniref:Uncharacterized protein n=1 Tax=Dendrothele bispora (strain CBS 962.96) TaxID=1314807 RepID=A0A4S8L6R5_DENBC|nr:hypothetical protein K435DRAFT_688074 [Dendrothele bispora CBS 962.96]